MKNRKKKRNREKYTKKKQQTPTQSQKNSDFYYGAHTMTAFFIRNIDNRILVRTMYLTYKNKRTDDKNDKNKD